MRTTPLGPCAFAEALRNRPAQNRPIKDVYRIVASCLENSLFQLGMLAVAPALNGHAGASPARNVMNARRLRTDVPYPTGLLRGRRERPRCRHAAEERDELAPSHVFLSTRGLQPTISLQEMPRCASQQIGGRCRRWVLAVRKLRRSARA